MGSTPEFRHSTRVGRDPDRCSLLRIADYLRTTGSSGQREDPDCHKEDFTAGWRLGLGKDSQQRASLVVRASFWASSAQPLRIEKVRWATGIGWELACWKTCRSEA